MAKYRKRPVVIDAIQWHLPSNMPEIVVPILISQDEYVIGEYTKDCATGRDLNVGFGIKTLEGWHIVTDGDWIITGVKGEVYPCKPDIFEQTYEVVGEE